MNLWIKGEDDIMSRRHNDTKEALSHRKGQESSTVVRIRIPLSSQSSLTHSLSLIGGG